ncbi:YegS/Rv2252/BmrU family lipid kinase [Bacillus sp. 1P06AnD]|uniref:YegS/Rv2252/BmrU family lipid kinase n=1 Tax=Bacillus sp. 1P06AnD TaxID=3132208 RepID=UPI00399F4A7D
MKWRKGILIYNGNAGQKDLGKALGACVPVLSPHVSELTLMPTQEQGDAEDICKRVGEHVDVLFILGGDGTVHECINGLAGLASRPIVGILPGGTCNDFSRELNMPQDIEKAAMEMIEGETSLVDVGKVNDRYFLNFWGIGLIADTSSNIDSSQKNVLGKVSYFLSALRTAKEAESFSFRLEYNGGVIEDEAVLILAGNGRFIGTNKLPFQEIDRSDGLLDIIIVKNSNLAVFKDILFSSEYAEPENRTDRDLIYVHSDFIRIKTDKQMDADTDGELYLSTPAEITVLPEHLHFICKRE